MFEAAELHRTLSKADFEAALPDIRARLLAAQRERLARLCDPGTRWLEVGLLVAHDRYAGQAPAAGVVTGVGVVAGRDVVVVANDATVKAGSWWPETITKMLRAQEIAMRERIPIVYLVDSGGVNLPYQAGVFPGQYGAGRLFYYNSLMRRYLHVPQLAAVMGQCVAGGAYLPALSDVIVMVDGTSFMGLGGPNLVKGATGQVVDRETLGGARMHTATSGVAHYLAKHDADALEMLREQVARLPRPAAAGAPQAAARAPARTAEELYDLLPTDHRMFSPEVYVEAIKAAEKAGYDVNVVDSLSHAWEGEGGALSLVDQAAAKNRGGNSYVAWRQVTPLHNKLVDAMHFDPMARLFFRSAIRGVIMLGFAGAGFFAHSVYLYHRAVSAQGLPLSTMQDWYLLAAWLLAGAVGLTTRSRARLIPITSRVDSLGLRMWWRKPRLNMIREPPSTFCM